MTEGIPETVLLLQLELSRHNLFLWSVGQLYCTDTVRGMYKTKGWNYLVGVKIINNYDMDTEGPGV